MLNKYIVVAFFSNMMSSMAFPLVRKIVSTEVWFCFVLFLWRGGNELNKGIHFDVLKILGVWVYLIKSPGEINFHAKERGNLP